MRVLVIGGGGREHALCWKIAQSERCEALFCGPGNAGAAEVATLVPELDASDHDGVVRHCAELDIDLVVVGPEQPLVDGLSDALRERGVVTFGPSAAAARLEGSKSFAKDFMARAGIPTAACSIFDDGAALLEHLGRCPLPTVVKADGLAAGKGVLICTTREEALAAGRAMVQERRFGEAGARVVVEDFLEGEEASFLALVDGETVVPLLPSQDHKRRGEGDTGPNTGGMGAYVPVPSVDAAVERRVLDEVLRPAARQAVADGTPYSGLLYAGLMLCADGPRVVEFNCRFGDPECQPLMVSLESDLLELLWATACGELAAAPAPRWREGATICVVLVSGGYPGKYSRGLPIAGLDDSVADTVVFHAGTARDHAGRVVNAGGRVLGVCGSGVSLTQAARRAYARVDQIQWEGSAYRRDIGWRALAHVADEE